MAGKRITDLTTAAELVGDEFLELAQLSDTIKITATTISAQASDNSFNDSGSGFVSAGFAVGDRVSVKGFTGNIANNIFAAVVTALTTGKMTIGGTDGDVIVDDAAGESVTIAKWTSRRATAQDIADLGGGGGIPDAPSDGKIYGRKDAAWEEVVGGGGNSAVQTEAGDYTISPGDNGHYIRLTNASAKTISIDLDSTTALPANGEWHFRNVGAGNATIDPDVGVTVNPPADGTLVVPQGGTITLKRVAEDEFDLLGQTVAA